MANKDADWKGALRLRFRWSSLSFEWGRLCEKTNALGHVRASWWEWESEAKEKAEKARAEAAAAKAAAEKEELFTQADWAGLLSDGEPCEAREEDHDELVEKLSSVRWLRKGGE